MMKPKQKYLSIFTILLDSLQLLRSRLSSIFYDFLALNLATSCSWVLSARIIVKLFQLGKRPDSFLRLI